ncbi:MAG: MFS transporter [Candidatus Aminicenantaceae bacterium]
MASKRKIISYTSGGLSFLLFLAILLVDFADQSLLPPLINTLLEDFFQDTVNVVPLGWVTFTFTILSAISMIVAGIYADRKSRVKICFAGCLVFCVSSALTIFVPHGQMGYVFFYITRALNGIGVGAIIPTIFSLVGDTANPNRRSTAFGFVSAAILIGRMAGFVLAGSLADHWRMAYFMVGVTGLILAFGLLRIPEPKRGAQEEELHDLIVEGAEYRFRISKKDIKHIWANKSNFWLIVNFIDVIPGSILIFLIFKYMKDIHNMEAFSVNFVILMVVFSGVFGALSFGRIGDWGFQRDKRAKAMIALLCNVFPILFMILFLRADFWIPEGATLSQTLAVPGVWALIITIVAAMFINQGVNPNWYSSLTDINLPEHRATMISFASIMDLMGQAIGPLVASYLATIWDLKTAMWSVLVFWVLNIFLWLPVLAHIRGDLANVHRVLKERALEMKDHRH